MHTGIRCTLKHAHTCLKTFKSQPCLWHFMTFIIHECGSSVSVCDRVTNAIYISYCYFSKLNMMVSISGCEQRKCVAVCVLVHVGQTTYTIQINSILLFALCTMLQKHKASLLRNYSYQACKKIYHVLWQVLFVRAYQYILQNIKNNAF